jgi:hypothetical protein
MVWRPRCGLVTPYKITATASVFFFATLRDRYQTPLAERRIAPKMELAICRPLGRGASDMFHPARYQPFSVFGVSKLGAVAAIVLLGTCPAHAQTASARDQSADARVKALEKERDELRVRNLELENRLKQLQRTVDSIVSDTAQTSRMPALAGSPSSVTPPAAQPPDEKSNGTSSASTPATTSTPTYASSPVISPVDPLIRRRVGPYYSPLGPGPITNPLQAPADLIGLAVAYQDALAERQAVPTPKDKQFWPNFSPADRKVRLLRSITKTIRDQVADEVERMHQLAAVHAVPTMDARNMQTKLRILDLILAQDPEAPSETTAPTDKPAK